MTLLLTRGRSTGGSALPAGYIAAEFLESTGTQYIKTSWKPLSEKADNLTSGFKIDQQLIEGKIYTMGLVYSNNFLGLSSTAWYGGVTDLYFGSRLRLTINETHSKKRMLVSMNYKDSRELNMQAADFTRTEILSTQTVTAVINNPMPLFTKSTQDSYQDPATANCRIWSVEFTEGSSVVHNIVAAITPEGEPCMYDKVNKETFTNSGSGQFIVGMTCKQALKLAELPSTGGSLTVSLPWEAQLDYGVYEALQVAKSHGWTITVQYRDAEPDSAVYNKYAACTTVADIAAVNPNFRTDLTADGGWIYPLPELTNLANIAWGGSYSPDMPIKYLDCDAPKVKYTNPGFVHTSQPKWARGDWSGVLNGTWMFGSANKKTLRNVEMVFPKLQSGDAMFYYAMLNKESVLRILGSIPSYTSGTHKLTIGIHVDHEFDEEVAAAIADAEAKGWTIEEQWNGTATAQAASTFGLRRKPVYAKVSEYEGEKYLSWGHYVTDWDANGYQEFGSVEEAKEYFNIGD